MRALSFLARLHRRKPGIITVFVAITAMMILARFVPSTDLSLDSSIWVLWVMGAPGYTFMAELVLALVRKIRGGDLGSGRTLLLGFVAVLATMLIFGWLAIKSARNDKPVSSVVRQLSTGAAAS